MILFLFIFFLIAQSAEAVTIWVSPSGGASTASSCAAAKGDTDPGAYVTRLQGITCQAAGETLMFKSGTYTEAATDIFNQFGNAPAGLGVGQETKFLCEVDLACIIRPSSGPAGSIVAFRGRPYIIFGAVGQGFDVDGANVSKSYTKCVNGIRFNNTGIVADVFGSKIIGNRVRNWNCFGISFNSSAVEGAWDGIEVAYNNVEKPVTPIANADPADPSPGSPSHGIYVSGINMWVHHNKVYMYNPDGGNSNYTMQCYGYCRNSVFEYNLTFAEGRAIGTVSGGTHGAENGNTFRHNVIIRIGAPIGAKDTCHDTLSGGDDNNFDNNTCVGFALDIYNITGSTGNKVRNAICSYSGGACTIGGTAPGLVTQTTNNLNVASSVFTNTATFDYSLNSTAGALVDAGTDIGLAFNGTAPDLGAYETFTAAAASIALTSIDITLGMNLNTPPQMTSGSTGWSVGCTGTGCGTPVVSGVALKSGSTGIVTVSITGITGGACAVGQTWTVSFNSGTGTVEDSSKIGNAFSQKMGSLSSYTVMNSCGGGGTPAPGTPWVYYKLDDGAGTSANDESANNLDGTLTNTPTWVSGYTGTGINIANATSQYVAVPYGNTVNPSSQSLTIAIWAYVTPGTESTSQIVPFAAPLGTNQRLYVQATSGTWRIAIQSSSSGTASDLSVVSGWNRLCLVMNSGTDTATLYNNGVAATSAGGVKAYTSYALAGNFAIGRITDGGTAKAGIYDEFKIWTSVENCVTDYASYVGGTPVGGTFSQATHVFQYVYTNLAGSPVSLGANGALQEVVDGGGVAIVFQINCDNVSNCDPTSFTLRYSTDGTNFNNSVPDSPTSDGVYFWGTSNATHLNSGTASGPLTGALTHTNGSTQLVAAAVPVIDLAQNTSLTLRYIVRFSSGLTGANRYFKLYQQSGTALGTYTPSSGARVTIVPQRLMVGF